MLRDKINNKKNDSKQVKSHKKRTTNKIKRKWRTIFNFGSADMFSKANREMEGGVSPPRIAFPHTVFMDVPPCALWVDMAADPFYLSRSTCATQKAMTLSTCYSMRCTY